MKTENLQLRQEAMHYQRTIGSSKKNSQEELKYEIQRKEQEFQSQLKQAQELYLNKFQEKEDEAQQLATNHQNFVDNQQKLKLQVEVKLRSMASSIEEAKSQNAQLKEEVYILNKQLEVKS